MNYKILNACLQFWEKLKHIIMNKVWYLAWTNLEIFALLHCQTERFKKLILQNEIFV